MCEALRNVVPIGETIGRISERWFNDLKNKTIGSALHIPMFLKNGE